MEITKNNIINISIWVFILLFMTFKSMDHTLAIYQDSFDHSFRSLQKKFKSRNEYLNVVLFKPGFKNLEQTALGRLIVKQKNQSNLAKNLLVNLEISDYLEAYDEKLLFNGKESQRLDKFDASLDSYLLAYNARAIAFNKKLNEFPYNLYGYIRSFFGGWPYNHVHELSMDMNKGLIVER